jgi:hypothetical protein
VLNAFFNPASATNPKLAAITATEWLPLGVFTPPPQGAMPPTSFQQLAINKSGQIQGVMVDSATNTVQPISGVVNLSTRTASWSVGQPGGLGFESSLDRLLEPAPAVTVVTPSSRQPGTLVLMTHP